MTDSIGDQLRRSRVGVGVAEVGRDVHSLGGKVTWAYCERVNLGSFGTCHRTAFSPRAAFQSHEPDFSITSLSLPPQMGKSSLVLTLSSSSCDDLSHADSWS